MNVFELCLDVTIRPCRRGDLRKLEWYGLYWAHRELIAEAFERQQRDEVLMLVADANAYPIGQVWIDFTKKRASSIGVLWALRVHQIFWRKGVARRLIIAAEQALIARGFDFVELGVEHDNFRARSLYQQLGFEYVGEEREEVSWRRPDGREMSETIEQWLLRKPLDRSAQKDLLVRSG